MPRSAFWVLGSALTLSLLTTACGSGGNPVTPPPPATTVHATVSALPSSGTVPLATNVTVAVSGNATGMVRYQVHFGDGTSLDTTLATDSYTPAHTYVSTGVYTVQTTVTRDGATNTSSTIVYVQNVPPPPPPPTISVSATASPISGFAPLSVTVTISVTGTATGPVTYRANFGDGVMEATSTQGSHTFTKVLANGGTTYSIGISATRQGVTDSTPTIKVTPENVPPIGTRTTLNRPDERSGPKYKYVYMTVLGGVDRGLDTNGVLRNTILATNNWMLEQTGWAPWIDEWSGSPDILYLRSSKTEPEMIAASMGYAAQLELVARGFNDPNTRYIVFLEAQAPLNPCGQPGPQIAINYLQQQGCKDVLFFATSPTGSPGTWGYVTLHEMFHIAGAVSTGASDYDAVNGGHVSIACDLMFYLVCQNVTIDATGRNYFGDNVPAGVVNIKNDPYFRFVRAPNPGLRALGSSAMLAVPIGNDVRRP